MKNNAGRKITLSQINLKKINRKLKKELDDTRYEHTQGVAYTAAALAMKYNANIQAAMTAGLLHDCAKCIPNDKKLLLCKKYKIAVTEIESQNPYLLHSKLGSFYAMKKYGVEDRDIINAILNHTTGRPEMSMLEKIIYIADYIEPNRKKAPNLETVRRVSFEKIDEALLMILSDTLDFLKSTGGAIDPMSQMAYEYYYNEISNNK